MEFLRQYQLEITLGVAVVAVIEFLILMSVSSRLGRISRTLRNLFSGPEGADLEALLRRCQDQSERALQHSDELGDQLRDLSLTVRGCIQNCGLVRYDAFGDVSGQQSFSLAILDADRNGAVVSGLFSRQDSRCYGKAIIGGEPEQSLSEEEQRALEIALSDTVSAPMVRDATKKRGLLRR